MTRCFFALWPDEALAGSLHALAEAAHASCGGRLMRRDTLHLTLAFLGEISADRVAAARAAADALAGTEGFDLTLDRLGYWQHNRILWAGGVSPRLTLLADGLATRLRAAGFALDTRGFAAHVTLLRDARCEVVPTMPAALAWPVREFVLAESRPAAAGARYDIIGRWPLRS